MNLNAGKMVAVIFLGLWLLGSGFFTAMMALFAQLAPDPGYVRLKETLAEIIPGYILFGLGPVIGFAVLANKLGHPLGNDQLIGLGICAVIPFLWFLLLRFWN